ncbi:AAA family ATPase (plasmid) [Streptomyces sp. NBC_00053]|uniref:helix-turn-helix transcriptional regulator n=1 Tax=unclassified Streptomyces TaxID=2593676 RepID=UPI002253C9E5|nr:MULTISPECIES: LuxR family transcriptional regulator [unclassified Streptomyces]MCX5505641.1 AAA family ATPase [Streptomyces sp. NBC_00052]MCX5553896.1 AAA family ATPase [Streptomyces sp. NBC_00051]WSC33853.1 AAA family ATPase [Streptomyces sp. NBC_01768]WSG56362.1 AAA family ATPase [Streptomyces sp. NBC_01732]
MLVERERELEILDGLFAETATGQGRIVLVSGAVANGKTELLRTFIDRNTAGEALFLSATATAADRETPFGVLRQLLDCMPLSTERIEELISPERELETVRRATAALLEVARTAPLVVIVDDVHHTDEPSMDCLLRMSHRSRSTRTMLMLAESAYDWSMHPSYRIELVRQTHFRRIRLAPLSVTGVCEMLTQHLGREAARSLAFEVHEATGGNQLLVRALIEDHGDEVESFERVAGESFRQAVLTCLQRSGPDALAVARALAVLDTAASADRVASLIGLDPDMVTRLLHALNSLGLLDGDCFRHPLGRAAVYEDLSGTELAQLHTEAAQLLRRGAGDAIEVAEHLVAAKSVRADWAVGDLRRAAEEALAVDDDAAAIKYVEFALSVCTEARQRAQLRMLLIRAEWRRDPGAAARHLTALFQEQRDGHLDAEQTAELVRRGMWHRRTEETTEALAQLVRLRPTVNEPIGSVLSSTRDWLSHTYPQFLPVGTDGPPVPQADSVAVPPAQQDQAAAVLSTVLRQGDGDGRCTRVAEQILQGTPLTDNSLEAITAAIQTLVYGERLPMAARWCDMLLAEAEARGVIWWQAVFSGCRAEIAIRNGELVDAERHAVRALDLIGPHGWGVAVGVPLGALLYTATAMGDFESARKYLKEPVPSTMFQTRYGLYYQRARGRYYLATDRLQAALADFRYCGELMTAWGMDTPALVPWRSDSAEVHLRLGDHERAQQLAQEQMSLSGSPKSRTHGASLRVLAATIGHRGRLQLLKESVEVLQVSGDRLTLTQALYDLSRVHQVLGEFGKARMISRRAGRLAKECRVQRMQEQIAPSHEQPLMLVPDEGDTWKQPDATARQAADMLTLSERKVAALASLGYTNREISGKLHITVSTVEQHLTKIFRKLKVKRRTDLPVELEFHAASTA